MIVGQDKCVLIDTGCGTVNSPTNQTYRDWVYIYIYLSIYAYYVYDPTLLDKSNVIVNTNIFSLNIYISIYIYVYVCVCVVDQVNIHLNPHDLPYLLICSHVHFDHTGGNHEFSKYLKSSSITSSSAQTDLKSHDIETKQFAHTNNTQDNPISPGGPNNLVNPYSSFMI